MKKRVQEYQKSKGNAYIAGVKTRYYESKGNHHAVMWKQQTGTKGKYCIACYIDDNIGNEVLGFFPLMDRKFPKKILKDFLMEYFEVTSQEFEWTVKSRK